MEVETAILKYFTSIVALIFVLKTLIWNKIALLASHFLNFPELVVNELKKSILKKYLLLFLCLSGLALLNVKNSGAYN